MHMKRLVLLVTSFVFAVATTGLFFSGCDSGVNETIESSNGLEIASQNTQLALAEGDRVQVVAGGADVYDRPNGTVVDVAAAGAAGEVDRINNGWVKVIFDSPLSGDVVLESQLEPESASTTPTASFTFFTTLLEVTFTDASTDDGSIVSWAWGFGDGATSTDQNPVYTYAASGTYSVSLTVTDDSGETDTVSQDVVVDESQDPCTVKYGFIGMSNTYQMARGMRRLGWDCAIWPAEVTEGANDSPVQGIGKGTIGTWAKPESRFYDKMWSTFSYGMETFTDTDVILWEVAIGLRDMQDDVPIPSEEEIGWLTIVYNMAKTYNPDLQFIIYGMPDYVNDCPQTGMHGPAKAGALADIATNAASDAYLPDAIRGPVLPLVGPEDLGHDDCHLNDQGEDEKAAAMIAWLESQ